MAIDVKNKGCNTGFSRASLNSRISGRLQEPKKYIRIRGEDFFLLLFENIDFGYSISISFVWLPS